MGFFDSLPLVLGHPAVADAIRRQAQANRAATAAQAPDPVATRLAQSSRNRASNLAIAPQGNQRDTPAWPQAASETGSEEAPIRLSSSAPDYAAVPGATGGSARTYGFSVDDLVESHRPIFVAGGMPMLIGGRPGEQPVFRLKRGVPPQQFLTELNSRAEAELGFTPDSARRFREQTGNEPVGRFFQGAEPRNASLNAAELLKTIRVGPDGNAIFQMAVPLASQVEYADFFAPQKLRERAELLANIERERAKVQETSADTAAHWLIRNSPIIGPTEDLWPEAGRNLRQAAEEATRRATLGWVDPTLGGKAQGDSYNTTGATVGGIAGGIVPTAATAAALTAVGQPELIPLAVGAQSLIERRPDEKAYGLGQRSLEGLAQGGTVWAAGGIPAGGFFKTLAAQQVPFVAGPYLTTPFVANRFPTARETAQQAALGVAMPLAHRAMGRSLREQPPRRLPEWEANQAFPGASTSQKASRTASLAYADSQIPDYAKEIALNIAERVGFGKLPDRRAALKLIATHPDTAPNVRAALQAILDGEIQPRETPELSINKGRSSRASDTAKAVVRTSPQMKEALASRGVAGDNKSIMLRGVKGSDGFGESKALTSEEGEWARTHQGASGYEPLTPHPDDVNVKGGSRGRYQAAMGHAQLPRAPKDWDVHHSIPKDLRGDERVEGIDLDSPAELRGVRGYRQPGPNTNVHGYITDEWAKFFEDYPKATREQILNFRDYLDWRYGFSYWESQARVRQER